MKTTTTPVKVIGLITAGAVALLAGCSKSSDRSSSSTNSDTAATSSTSSPASGSTTTGSTGAGAGATATTATGSSAMSTTQNVSWDQVKDLSYDQRNELAAKANDYAAKLDRDATSAKGNTAKHLADARDNLRSAAAEISNATSDTWNTTKQHVADAWQKAEAAYQNAAE
jgi:hypothetical protein